MAALPQFSAVVAAMRVGGAHDGHREITAGCDVCSILQMMRLRYDDPITAKFVEMHLREPANDFWDYGTWEVAPRSDVESLDFGIEAHHEEMMIRGEPYIPDPRRDDATPGYRWVLRLSLGLPESVSMMCEVIKPVLEWTTPGSYAHYNLRRELLRHESSTLRDYPIIE